MKVKFVLLILLVILGGSLAGCAKKEEPLTPEDEVAKVYWDYWEACDQGKEDLALTMLTSGAIEEAQIVGACGFTHDYINQVPQYSGGVEHTYSTDPEILIIEERAGLTWLDDQGTLTTVILRRENGVWMVHETIWSL